MGNLILFPCKFPVENRGEKLLKDRKLLQNNYIVRTSSHIYALHPTASNIESFSKSILCIEPNVKKNLMGFEKNNKLPSLIFKKNSILKEKFFKKEFQSWLKL
jgi:hypothetical protein